MDDSPELAAIRTRDAAAPLWGPQCADDRRALLRMLDEALKERDAARDENKWLRVIVNHEFGDNMEDTLIAQRRDQEDDE